MASASTTRTRTSEEQPQQPSLPSAAASPSSSLQASTTDAMSKAAARPTPTPSLLPLLASAAACNKQLLFCRRFKDASAGNVDGASFLRNFNSLPLFVYATSPSTHAISADGVGVAKEAAAAAAAASAFSQKV
ncbi:hypothetical protein AWZ03_003132 [Drosophila navojoa]|uniref:Uncharacterized protein n=1 Tax=Drosophila navojoa TaxID=7232 RepID=A0A484BP49_DRONA|nr:hypothetical protein AWZ03_003132 [Drosophila navojoa]